MSQLLLLRGRQGTDENLRIFQEKEFPEVLIRFMSGDSDGQSIKNILMS